MSGGFDPVTLSGGTPNALPLAGGTMTGLLLNSAAAYSVAGANQAAATPITTNVAYVNAGGTGGVRLPAATAGQWVLILKPDSGSVNATIYPATGDAISPGAANAG